jgi:hypothetical protein
MGASEECDGDGDGRARSEVLTEDMDWNMDGCVEVREREED